MTGIMMLVVLFIDILILDESYASTLLVFKARQLRHETGNWALHAKHEEWEVSIDELARKYLIRPFQIVLTPICFCMGMYAAFVYGILYLYVDPPLPCQKRLLNAKFILNRCFAAFPIEFEQERGWNQLVGSLPFIATLIGCIIGAGINVYNTKFYVQKLEANKNRPVPEARLPPMMLGGVLFAGGLFIFGWTSNKDIPWIAFVALEKSITMFRTC